MSTKIKTSNRKKSAANAPEAGGPGIGAEEKIRPGKTVNRGEKLVDPLQDSFRYILSLQGKNPDLESVRAAMESAGDFLEPAGLQEMADKIGMKAQIKKIPFGMLGELAAPVILLLKEKKAIVRVPAQGEGVGCYLPGKGKVEWDQDSLRDSYLGHAVLITAKGKDDATTAHMWKQGKVDWFWQPIRAYWPGYAEILVCSLFINLFVIALPIFTMNVYDRVVPNFAVDTLFVLTLGITLALSFDFLFRTIRAHILEKVAARLSVRFDRALMERLIDLSPDATSMTIGEKTNIFKELQGLRDFYSTRLVPAFVDLPFALLFILVIHWIAPAVTLVPVAGVLAILAVQTVMQSLLTRSTRELFTTTQSKSSVLVEMLGGVQAIRMFGASGARLARWSESCEHAAASARRNQSALNVAGNLCALIMALVNVFVVFFGVYAIQSGDLSIGGLIAATILSGRAVAPVTGVAAVLSRLKQSRDVLRTIDTIFSTPSETELAASLGKKGPFSGQMELRNVTYQYKGQSMPAVQGINLSIGAGEKVGLIGQTGAGKSTLAHLLGGLVTPLTGTILYDGYAHDTILPAELRRSIGFVPQKAFFFSGTIRDNILLGAHDVSEQDFARAAELSGVNMYIQQTGQGYDTEIGEGGARLSGGQQQAISLARAMIRNPSILIFDEPTTGMDSMLEQAIQRNLKTYLKDKTFILVTHRTTLLPLVDRLVLLTRGRITSDGPRDEILHALGAGPAHPGGRS
ncbi:MAG: type I secretion system permease/ATPase [Rhodospirillales bacterium]|nr:type I secretion system permease/ATPase [Rhodospirillales bacterium]